MQPLTLLLILACALPLVHSKVFPCYVGSSETRRHVEYLHRDRCRYTIMPYGEVVYTAQGYEPSLSREDREEAQRNNVHHCSPRGYVNQTVCECYTPRCNTFRSMDQLIDWDINIQWKKVIKDEFY